MLTRILTALCLLSTILVVPSAQAARDNLSRQEVKSLPILERPYRFGHVYGNVVRHNARATGNGGENRFYEPYPTVPNFQRR